MDKKELQNLIDRIGLTGPEGIKKIKKVLKELNDGNGGSSSGSMGEDEEYIIAQALNDLNDRIKEVEARPVAQTHVLEVLDSIQDGTSQETLQLLKLDEVTPTFNDIKNVNLLNTCLYYSQEYLQIVSVYTTQTSIQIVAGFMDRDQDDKIIIDLVESDGFSHGSITIEQN